MKIHLAWIRVTAATAIAAGVIVQPAAAQYAPYRALSPQPAATQPAPAAATTATPYAPYRTPTAYPQTQPTARYQAPVTPVAPYQAPASAYRQPAVPYPQTAMAPYPATYGATPYVAQNQPTEVMPAPEQPATGTAATGETTPATTMPATAMPVAAASGYPAAGCNCGAGGSGSCGGYPDISGYMDDCGPQRQWFGGVFFLYMGRDNPNCKPLTTQFDTPAGGYPYYPAADVVVLTTSDADHDFRPGAEIRFGSTFSVGHSCDDECDGFGYGGYGGYGGGNCSGCCPTQNYAWELGYWFLDDNENTAAVIDSIPTDTDRIYGMKNFAGLQYNGEPVNLWYDYQMPVGDPANPPPWGSGTEVRILAQRVRTNFQAQNLELNIMRLPLCGDGGCGAGYGSYGCNACDAGNCAPACGSPLCVTTLCGFRYLRIDDDFEYGTMWAIDNAGTLTPPAYTPWDGAGELFYDVNVDNNLAGFQLGANVNYEVSCKCNLFWNTAFGVYNNRITSNQRVFGELGSATWAGSGADATFESHKDDVAFVGELLLGGSYNFTCNWRGVVAYRAVAVSGVALSVNQIPEDFSNQADVALIDSNGSIIIHGVQIGAEYRY